MERKFSKSTCLRKFLLCLSATTLWFHAKVDVLTGKLLTRRRRTQYARAGYIIEPQRDMIERLHRNSSTLNTLINQPASEARITRSHKARLPAMDRHCTYLSAHQMKIYRINIDVYAVSGAASRLLAD